MDILLKATSTKVRKVKGTFMIPRVHTFPFYQDLREFIAAGN